MTNKEITQELDISVDALDFRLDILRLTFKIEEKIENSIKKVLKSDRIPLEDFINKTINKKTFNDFKKFYIGSEEEAKVWNINKRGNFFNVKNFINSTTFGGLLKLIEIMKFDEIKSEYRSILPDLEYKVFKGWVLFIKTMRNALAHRTNIDPSTFFEKLQFPMNSKNLNTKRLNSMDLKKYVLNYFLKEERLLGKNKIIFEKYNLDIAI